MDVPKNKMTPCEFGSSDSKQHLLVHFRIGGNEPFEVTYHKLPCSQSNHPRHLNPAHNFITHSFICTIRTKMMHYYSYTLSLTSVLNGTEQPRPITTQFPSPQRIDTNSRGVMVLSIPSIGVRSKHKCTQSTGRQNC